MFNQFIHKSNLDCWQFELLRFEWWSFTHKVTNYLKNNIRFVSFSTEDNNLFHGLPAVLSNIKMPRHNALFHNSRIVFIIETIKHLEKQAYKFKNKNNIVYKIVFFLITFTMIWIKKYSLLKLLKFIGLIETIRNAIIETYSVLKLQCYASYTT